MSDPPTPPSERPAFKDSRFKPIGTACEPAESYRPSGFHPVHLGDVLRGRYRILRKLGYGQSSTVWLARDSISSTYVALKIHAAKMDVSKELEIQQYLGANSPKNTNSGFVLLATDSFMLEGPNGKHYCFVTEPMGPSISAVLNAPVLEYDPLNPPARRFPTTQTKRLLRNVLCGLEFLHSNNVVHGDLQSGNLLFSLKDLTALDPSKLLREEPTSERNRLVRKDGKADRWAPKYLLVPDPLTEESLPRDEQVVKLADFGGAFWADKPPENLVTPVALRAPETILHDRTGPPIDIWSFGCLMFELLTEYPLFELDTIGGQRSVTDDDHLVQLSQIIGALPEDLLSKWPRRNLYFGPGGERLDSIPTDFVGPRVGRAPRSGRPLRHPPAPFPSLEDMFHKYTPDDTSDAENKEIASLLRDILQIEPLKRPSATQLLGQPWFQS